jgi:hypothetical protein
MCESMCAFLSTYSFISNLKFKKLHVIRNRNLDTSITNGHDAEVVLCTGLPYNFFSQDTLKNMLFFVSLSEMGFCLAMDEQRPVTAAKQQRMCDVRLPPPRN